MTEKELEKKAKEYADETQFTEYANSSLSESLDISEEIKQVYIAGAKLMQKELEEQMQNLAKRICELQSDLAREKSKNERITERLEKDQVFKEVQINY